MLGWEILLWGAIALIGYTYLGYGVLIGALARLRPRPWRNTYDLPRVTLVIAAYNEAAVIGARLANALALDYPPERLEILVVADGCTDGTEAVVRGLREPRVRLLARPVRAGKVNALNAAIPLAQGEIVVGSDANCFFAPDCLRRLVAPFGDPQVAMVAGEKRIRAGSGAVAAGEGLYWRYEAWLKRQDARVSSVLGATGEVFALRKERFEPLPADAIIEDFMLSMGLVMQGWRVVYEPRAIATESASASIHEEFKRKVRIVAGGWQAVIRLWPLLLPTRGVVAFQYVSHRVLRWMVVPLALPVAYLANLVLAWHGRWVGLLVLQTALYLAAALGYLVQGQGAHWRALQVPFYFVFLNLAALRGAWRFLRGRQSVLWEKAQRAEP